MGTVAAFSIGMAVRAHRRGVCDQRSGKPTFSTGFASRSARSFATKSDQGRTRPHVPETLRLGIQRAAAPVLLGGGVREGASDGADRPRDVSLVCRGVSVCGHDAWRTSICTHHPLLRICCARDLRIGARCDDHPRGLLATVAFHDLRKRGLMSSGMSRRKMLTTGIGAAAGVTGLAVADRIAGRYGLIPPDSGGIFGPGETLTYAAQR